MRITHQMLSRNYLTRMNTNLTNLTKSNEKMSSQRAFDKSWENVSDAGRALKVRKLVTDNERYQTSIRDAQGRAAAAEDAMRTVTALLTRAEDRVINGLNGTMEDEDRAILAKELASAQNEIFQLMNSTFAEKHVFTAAGNADGKPPFAIDTNGKLTYQGYVVDELTTNPATAKPAEFDGTNYTDIKWNEHNYVDIGFGYSMGADGKVDPNTAFRDTYSGIESFGFGVDDDGNPVNVYSLFGKMVDDLNNNNMDELNKDLGAIPKAMDFMLKSITDVGARVVTLNDTQDRLESEYINLVDKMNDLEGIDLTREIINNKDFEMSWLVTLQLGSKILPQTIFDFMR